MSLPRRVCLARTQLAAPRGKTGLWVYGILDRYICSAVSHANTRRYINTHILVAATNAIDATLAHVAERAAPVRPDTKREGPRVVRLRVAEPRDEAIG
jgi:hypothetical protein